ncbi:MAG: oxidoreductase [Deltaproteobacteria bacterium GWC2_42_11]|nr:MAG: oxidoreductase [Deltaproteobacteria bacterium GWC2_42_11]HBO83399.1 oxidoreductase [Deltaproteobacteria bacterium]
MESPYLLRQARIERITRLTEKERLFRLVFEDDKTLGHVPGQFIMLSIFGAGEAPISVSSPPDTRNEFEICVRVVGSLTNVLHTLLKGSTVGIRGPYGKGFPVKEIENKDILLIAGGIGLVPMRSLIKTILLKRGAYGRITLLYGVKSPEDILFKDELDEWSKVPDFDLRITVDKPHPLWKGHTGVVTRYLPELKIDAERTAAVIVGPPVMYKYVIMGLGEKRIAGHEIFLSLERRMKCGIGKCGHCQINSVYICQEGPVFRLSDIRRLREAI